MTTKVKICGIRTADALAAALDGGADYVGFVFFPPSPRNISPQAAAPLAAQARGRALIVALMVDPDDALVVSVLEHVAPDVIQLHGNETPERVAEVGRLAGRPVMKAIKVETAADAARALDYKAVADLILFDAKPPRGADRPGGHGATFDWHTLDGVKHEVDWMLSGGLTPDNVAAAIGAPARRRSMSPPASRAGQGRRIRD